VDADPEMAQALSASTRQRMSVASILVDFGAQCSATADAFRQVLREIGIALDEEQLAEIIVCISAQDRTPELGETAEVPDASRWNTEVIGEVLSQECRTFDWTAVVKKLDQPLLKIRSEADFLKLVGLFSLISGTALPDAPVGQQSCATDSAHPWSKLTAYYSRLLCPYNTRSEDSWGSTVSS
jgi:hypothetical protein